MRPFVFSLLTIAGLVGGIVVGMTQTKYGGYDGSFGIGRPILVTDSAAMAQCAVGGTVLGMVVGGIALWLTGKPPKP